MDILSLSKMDGQPRNILFLSRAQGLLKNPA